MNLNKTAQQNLKYIAIIILVLLMLPKISKMFEGYDHQKKEKKKGIMRGLMTGPAPMTAMLTGPSTIGGITSLIK